MSESHLWGCAPYEDEEWSVSSAADRDGIIAEARIRFGDTFVIGRFGPPPRSKFSIDAEDLIELALEGSGPASISIEDEVGEDGEHGLDNLGSDTLADLQDALDEVTRAWCERHDIRGHLLTGPSEIEHFSPDSEANHG